jgi:hypothetical protein
MIVAIFRGALHWFVGLIEVVAVVTTILLVGLVVGLTGFWILGRSLSKLEGPSAELDPQEYEMDEDVGGRAISFRRDSPPSDL